MEDSQLLQDAVRPLLRIKQLRKHYPVHASWYKRSKSLVHAVDGISFDVGRGESFGLAGESGCGKTTAGKLIVRLADATSGSIIFDDGKGQPVDVATLAGRNLRAYRKNAQMIFQDPYESIKPPSNGLRHDSRAAAGPEDRQPPGADRARDADVGHGLA